MSDLAEKERAARPESALARGAAPGALLRPEATGWPPLAEGAAATPRAAPPAQAERGPSAYVRHGARLFDAVLLVALLPIVALPALAVAIGNLLVFGDPRRILFYQDRVGRDGRVFRIHKFRTMRDEVPGPGHMESWSSGRDRLRVTRFGRFLRNTHLDELPQLVNVLRGEMRLVGPRPEMIEVHAWARAHVPGFERRLAVRPGITGLAQVTQGYTGPCVETYAQKLALDLRYIAGCSLATDVAIVARTVLWVLRGRGWGWNRPR